MASVEQDELVGRTVDGRYTVLTHIADGGMGSVYAALDTRLDRQVALKVMRPDLARDPDFVTRFRREARAAARLSHPNVVAVFDQGEDDGLLFLAMEFVDGQTLRDLLADHGALTPREALDIAADVLQALQAAHRKGILHRDIKPENVLVSCDSHDSHDPHDPHDPDDDSPEPGDEHSGDGGGRHDEARGGTSGHRHVKVADFGLARAMGTSTATGRTGPLLGTVAYLAPEQVEHGRSDERTDLYTAGLVLHEMLTGTPAVEGDSPIHIAWQHVNGTLARPSDQVPELPGALDELVARATRTNPDDRYATAADFLAAVRTTRLGLPTQVLDHRPDRVEATGAAAAEEAHEKSFAGVGAVTRSREQHHTRPLRRETQTIPRLEHSGSSAAAAGNPATTAPGPVEHTDPPPPDAPGDSRRHGRRTALLLALAAALIAAGGAAYWWFGPPGERTVPTLTGLDTVAAEQAVRDNDLVPVTEQQFSETAPADSVMNTDVQPGTVVRRGTPVTIVVSKGPERYDVPDVTGLGVEQARAAVTDAHLAPAATVREVYDDEVPKGEVVRTEPAKGTSSKPGTTVTLVVSKGRQPVPVDDIPGMPLADAQARLEKFGITVTVADERVNSRTVPAGSIVSTSPTGTLHKGDEITLTVSKGPVMVAVPPVQGLSEREAVAKLKNAGFEVKVNRILGGVLGLARSTEPQGATAPQGSRVVLNVV